METAAYPMYIDLFVTQHKKTGQIHLFILQYVSPSLFNILEIYKLHEISYEKLHKWCKFY